MKSHLLFPLGRRTHSHSGVPPRGVHCLTGGAWWDEVVARVASGGRLVSALTPDRSSRQRESAGLKTSVGDDCRSSYQQMLKTQQYSSHCCCQLPQTPHHHPRPSFPSTFSCSIIMEELSAATAAAQNRRIEGSPELKPLLSCLVTTERWAEWRVRHEGPCLEGPTLSNTQRDLKANNTGALEVLLFLLIQISKLSAWAQKCLFELIRILFAIKVAMVMAAICVHVSCHAGLFLPFSFSPHHWGARLLRAKVMEKKTRRLFVAVLRCHLSLIFYLHVSTGRSSAAFCHGSVCLGWWRI